MAKKSKQQPQRRSLLDFQFRNDDDRTATQRLYDRLYGNREVGNGSHYIAVNRANWRGGITGSSLVAGGVDRNGSPETGASPDAPPDGHN